MTIKNVSLKKWNLSRFPETNRRDDGKETIGKEGKYLNEFLAAVKQHYSNNSKAMDDRITKFRQSFVVKRSFRAERPLGQLPNNGWVDAGNVNVQNCEESKTLRVAYDFMVDQDCLMLGKAANLIDVSIKEGETVSWVMQLHEKLKEFGFVPNEPEANAGKTNWGSAWELFIEVDGDAANLVKAMRNFDEVNQGNVSPPGLVEKFANSLFPNKNFDFTTQFGETKFAHFFQRSILFSNKGYPEPLLVTVSGSGPKIKKEHNNFSLNIAFKFSSLSAKAVRSARMLWDIQRRLSNTTHNMEHKLNAAKEAVSTSGTSEYSVDVIATCNAAVTSFLEWRTIYSYLEQGAAQAERNSIAYSKWWERHLQINVPPDHDWQKLYEHYSAEVRNYSPHLHHGQSIVHLLQAAAIENTKIHQNKIVKIQEKHDKNQALILSFVGLILSAIGCLRLFPDNQDMFWGAEKGFYLNIKAYFGSVGLVLTIVGLIWVLCKKWSKRI